jgi:hypothetical protein
LCPCDNFINEKECQCGMYEKIEVEKNVWYDFKNT